MFLKVPTKVKGKTRKEPRPLAHDVRTQKDGLRLKLNDTFLRFSSNLLPE